MTKKEICASALEILKKHNAPANLVKDITTLLEPKKGGATINIEDVFVPKAKDGKAYLLCSVSGVWMEATKANFYEDVSETNKFGGIKRLSRAAEGARKKFIAAKKTSEKAIMEDMLNDKIDKVEAKKQLAKFESGADFSKIEGSKVKPV